MGGEGGEGDLPRAPRPFALHFADFVLGLVRSEGIAFYLIVVAIALTLNTSYLRWKR